MQVSNIAIKEQENPNVTAKNQPVQSNGYFLSFLKDVDVQINKDASSILAKPSTQQSSVKDDYSSEKSYSEPKADEKNDKEETKADTKADAEDKSSSVKEDTKKDEKTEDNSENTQMSQETKPENVEKIKTIKDGTTSAQQEQVKNTDAQNVGENNQAKNNSSDTTVTIPKTDATSQQTEVMTVKAGPQVQENNGIVVPNGENFAGVDGEMVPSLPKTKIVVKKTGENVDIVESANIAENFKKLLAKGSEEVFEPTSVNSSENAKIPVSQQINESRSNTGNNVNPGMIDYSQASAEVIEQVDLLDKIIGTKNNPTKISVEVVNQNPEAKTSPIASDLLNVANANIENKTIKSETAAKVANKKININPEITQESSDRFSDTFSNVVKMAKEKILGGGQETKVPTDVKPEISDIGLGVGTKEQTSSSSSSDAEFLLLNKTYNQGKAAGAKNVSQAKTLQASPRQVIDQIKVQIKQSSTTDKIAVKLNPKELGQVELKVEVSKSGSMNVEITANKKETLELLKQDIKYLEKALQETVAKNESTPTFSFNLKGENQNQGENSQGFAGRQSNQNNNNENDVLSENNKEEVKTEEYQRSGISIKV